MAEEDGAHVKLVKQLAPLDNAIRRISTKSMDGIHGNQTRHRTELDERTEKQNHAKEGFTFDDEGLGPRSERADQVLGPAEGSITGRRRRESFRRERWMRLKEKRKENV